MVVAGRELDVGAGLVSVLAIPTITPTIDAAVALHGATVHVAGGQPIELARRRTPLAAAVVAPAGDCPVSYTHLDVYKRQVLIGPTWMSFFRLSALISF